MTEISVFRQVPNEVEARCHAHAERIQEALDSALSRGTRIAYAKAIRRLLAFAELEGFADWFSPATIAAHIVELGIERSMSTVAITLAAVRNHALESRIPSPTDDPTLRRVVAGVRRQIAERGQQVKRAHPLDTAEIARILGAIDDSTVRGKRDRAIITLIYAAALRRSEVGNLRRSDVRIGRDGMTVTIRRAKGDQLGAGAVVGVTKGKNPTTDPVAAMARWIAARGKVDAESPLFTSLTRSGNTNDGHPISGFSVAEILKRRAATAGLDVEARSISGHSGRRGHVTQAARAGADLVRIQRTTRHKNIQTLMTYIEEVNVLDTTTSSDLGL
jgi:integrase